MTASLYQVGSSAITRSSGISTRRSPSRRWDGREALGPSVVVALIAFGAPHREDVCRRDVRIELDVVLRTVPVVGAAREHVVELERRIGVESERLQICLLYTSPSPRDGLLSRMPSS